MAWSSAVLATGMLMAPGSVTGGWSSRSVVGVGDAAGSGVVVGVALALVLVLVLVVVPTTDTVVDGPVDRTVELGPSALVVVGALERGALHADSETSAAAAARNFAFTTQKCACRRRRGNIERTLVWFKNRPEAYSCTSSISVPKLPFGWMNATVVPRLPGRGALSIGVAPAAIIDASASPQSATR